MKLFYCNIRGLRSKQMSLETILDNIKPSIVLLAETQTTGRCKINLEGYDVNGVANKNSRSGGLLIATRKGTAIETIISRKEVKHQQLWAIVRSKGHTFRICLAYGYPNEHSIEEEDIDDWFITLEEEYLKQPEYDTILIGDFNAHTGTDNLPINKNGKNINALIERRNLINLNNENICQGKFTREDPNGTKTIIDYAIADENFLTKIKTVYIDDQHKYKPIGYRKVNKVVKETPTDHNVILVEIEVPTQRIKEKITKWNFSNQNCLDKFKNETENIIMKENWENEGDIEKKFKNWEKQIKSLIYKCFNRITIKEKRTNKTTKELINIKRKLNHEISDIQNQSIESTIVIKYLKERKTELLEEITTSIAVDRGRKMKGRLDQVCRKEVQDDIWQIRKKMLTKSNPKHTVNDKKGNILTTKKEIQERYQEYYKELLTNRPIHDKYSKHEKMINENFQSRMTIKKYDDHEINQKFEQKELQKAIKSMKNGKSPGPDQITYEILKHAGKNLQENMLAMMNYFWINEQIPTKMQTVYVKSMYKGKGNISELENQRGLFLASNILKTYEKMFMNRIYPEMETHGFSMFQCGGRKDHSPTDQVFVLRAAMEYLIYMGKEYFIEFCDLKKAFDKMILINVMDDLWESNIKGRIWRNIFTINQSTDIIIKTPYGETDKITVQQILKQGSVLASTLAALHTDSSNKYLQKELGMWYGNLHLHSLLFQDDIARIERKQENLNLANQAYEVFQNINGMQFHETKTVYISNKNKCTIKMNNEQLKQNKSVKYLGDIISDDNKYDENIEDRKTSINGILAEIRSIMNEAQEDIEITAAKQYYEGIVMAKLLYNCETWTNLTSGNLQELEKIQNNAIKRLLRIPFSTPSMGLLHELKLPTVKARIAIKKLMYFHKLLKNKESLAYLVLKEQENLPSNNFLKEIKEMLENYNITNNTDEIESMTKRSWKNIVLKAVKTIDQEAIKNWCQNSSKCKNLTDGKTNYIEEIDSPRAKIILMEKLNMTNVKSNYHGSYNPDDKLQCSLCNQEEETTYHLLQCSKLKETSRDVIDCYNRLKDNQTTLPDELKLLAQNIAQKLEDRDKLLNTAAINTSIDAITY